MFWSIMQVGKQAESDFACDLAWCVHDASKYHICRALETPHEQQWRIYAPGMLQPTADLVSEHAVHDPSRISTM